MALVRGRLFLYSSEQSIIMHYQTCKAQLDCLTMLIGAVVDQSINQELYLGVNIKDIKWIWYLKILNTKRYIQIQSYGYVFNKLMRIRGAWIYNLASLDDSHKQVPNVMVWGKTRQQQQQQEIRVSILQLVSFLHGY